MRIIRFFCLASLLSLPSLAAAHGTTVVVERDVPPTVSVAGGVTQRVIDLLEPVEVEHQHGSTTVGAPPGLGHMLDAVAE